MRNGRHLFLVLAALIFLESNLFQCVVSRGLKKSSSYERHLDWRNVLRPLQKRTGNSGPELVTECMKVVSKAGKYFVSSTGQTETCGIYMVANADEVVEVEVEVLDVSCENQGLVVFFDGWELNGKVFPSPDDHHLPMRTRFTEMCSSRISKTKRRVMKKFISSQNAALVQYRIPAKGEGFVVKVGFAKNPNPCNVLMSDLGGIFTLSNGGEARNCSFTTMLSPANIKILDMELGTDKVGASGEDCCIGGDMMEFGGSNDLESRDLLTKQSLCGCDKQRIKNLGMTVLCGTTTVRLISSGLTENKLALMARSAGPEDLDMNNLLLMCPELI